MKLLLSILLTLTASSSYSQELINGTYDFQSDPVKEFTLYIPSTYDATVPNDMMLALHPWNTSRWNGLSWCDTLKTFAETNGLLLVCPDGGSDGKIDDAIDTAFTSFLIDEVRTDYNINDDEIYAIGFSWGAKTVYTYGLQHADLFAGFIPVGAAVSSSEVSPHVNKASDKNFYVIHGSQDNPNVRYTPIINMLDGPHCVESQLLTGVGHTIDFPNRNTILTQALTHLKNNSCGATAVTDEELGTDLLLRNNAAAGVLLQVSEYYLETQLSIYNLRGELVRQSLGSRLTAPSVTGLYVVVTPAGHSQKLMVY